MKGLLSAAAGTIKLLCYKALYRKRLRWSGLPRLSPHASISVRDNGKVYLGNRSHFDRGTLLRVTDNAVFQMGESSGFNSYCVITCRDHITIGNHVMFGPFVTIHDHDHQYRVKGLMSQSGYTTTPIVIEDNVWIGGNVVILKGVRIGTGSVIAAGTVVTRDVPANTVLRTQFEWVLQKRMEAE